MDTNNNNGEQNNVNHTDESRDSIKTEQSNLEIEIKGFSDNNLIINAATKYELKLKKGVNFDNFARCFTSTSKINKDDDKDIFVNGFSIKDDPIAAKYLQQNCLILSRNMFLDNNLTVYDNIKIVSLMYSGYNLADACLSSFAMKEMRNTKVNFLTEEDKSMAILSYTVCCPSIIWIVDYLLIDKLSKSKFETVENAIKIRLKHGGVFLKVFY